MKSSRVVVTPTTAEDAREFLTELPWRIQAVTGRVDGEVRGIGGITMLPDGTCAVFLEASEEDCRKYPVTLHREALKFLAAAKARGIRKLVAQVDSSREAAIRWLERLGFEYAGMVDGEVVYIWQ